MHPASLGPRRQSASRRRGTSAQSSGSRWISTCSSEPLPVHPYPMDWVLEHFLLVGQREGGRKRCARGCEALIPPRQETDDGGETRFGDQQVGRDLEGALDLVVPRGVRAALPLLPEHVGQQADHDLVATALLWVDEVGPFQARLQAGHALLQTVDAPLMILQTVTHLGGFIHGLVIELHLRRQACVQLGDHVPGQDLRAECQPGDVGELALEAHDRAAEMAALRKTRLRCEAKSMPRAWQIGRSGRYSFLSFARPTTKVWPWKVKGNSSIKRNS